MGSPTNLPSIANIAVTIDVSGHLVGSGQTLFTNNSGLAYLALSPLFVTPSQTGKFGASGSFYPLVGNPSGFITPSQTGAFGGSATPTGNLTGVFYPLNNPSGFITTGQTGNFGSSIPTGNLTGAFYPLTSNPSGFINSTITLVQTTGNQIISGIKTFTTGINVANIVGISVDHNLPLIVVSGQNNQTGNMQTWYNSTNDQIANIDVNGNIQGKGFNLNSNFAPLSSISAQVALDVVNNLVFSDGIVGQRTLTSLIPPNTGLLTGNFYPLHSNPSGFITTGQTGSFGGGITGNLTGVFYPLNANPSGYITSSQTGAFGGGTVVVNTGQLDLRYVNVTGNEIISGVKTFTSATTFPTLNSNGADTVIDLVNYYLYDTIPSVSVKWNQYQLMANGNLSLDWNNNLLTGGIWNAQALKVSGQSVTTGGPYYPLNLNPSGFITSGQTGNFGGASTPTGNLTGAFYPLSSNPSGFITNGQTGTLVGTGQTSVSGGFSKLPKLNTSGDLVLWPNVTGSKGIGGNILLEGLRYIMWCANTPAPPADADLYNNIGMGGSIFYNYGHAVQPELQITSPGSISINCGYNSQKNAVMQLGSSGPFNDRINIQYDAIPTGGLYIAGGSKRFSWITTYWSGIANTWEVGTIQSIGTGDGSGNLQLLFTTPDAPSLKITNQGVFESTLGGFKFPDGTIQTSAAASVGNAMNESTLLNTQNLVGTDTRIQFFIASGQDRIINLPPLENLSGKEFYIKNVGNTNNLIIYNASGNYETTILPSWFTRLTARPNSWEFETQAMNTPFITRNLGIPVSGTGQYTLLSVPSGLKYVTQLLEIQTTYNSGNAIGAIFSLGDSLISGKIVSGISLSSNAVLDTYEQFSPKTNAGLITNNAPLVFTINSGNNSPQLVNVYVNGYFII